MLFQLISTRPYEPVHSLIGYLHKSSDFNPKASTMDMEGCYPDNTINVTDYEMASQLFYSSETKMFLYIVLAILFLTGMIGNSVFLLTVYRIQRMRSVTNAYLCNVAITDIIFITYSTGWFSHSLFIGSLKNGSSSTTSAGCIFTHSLFSFAYHLSIALITFASLDRFYAICLPFSHRAVSGKSHTFRVIAMAWVIAVIFSIAKIPTISRIKFQCIIWPNDQEIYQSLLDRRWICDGISNSVAFILYSIFIGPVIYAILLVANVVMYAGIIRTLSSREIANSGDQRKDEVKEVRNQVARLLIVLGIVFFICQSSVRLLTISKNLSKLGFEIFSIKQNNIVRDLSAVFLNLNPVIHPYLYVTLSKTYRDAFFEALNIKKQKRHCSKRINTTTTKAIGCEGQI